MISATRPEEYFPEIEKAHPGALASQWIPDDPELWKIENYLDFLEARKSLLATEVNKCMEDLLHGDTRWLEGVPVSLESVAPVVGGITSEEEDEQLEGLNDWTEEQGLPRGIIAFEFSDSKTGQPRAIFDLAWPNGVQEELSQPVAVLLDEEKDLITFASQSGYRCFVTISDFKNYVCTEILGQEDVA